ncbi:helix-turn-helix domain-containing protein [Pontibacter cellulosilyticus]|uniref:Helix-turn-helix transcriptional regulator n=1 Tax=Pontibacter cellulosilyticus TaxID=1720253 RepID=A0A923N2M4_9BACT|nr:AraC family transcriptional regulator [Pontibacter cellulosilyticus]MBC5991273.1 helix-turn-helix transcriptional regulator [Pontibacter cellulosilyticus]
MIFVNPSRVVPGFSKLVQGQTAVPVPPDSSHIYHSFFKTYFGDTVNQHGYALKYVVNGRERYTVNGRRHTVTDGKLLVVGHGSACKVEVNENETVEGLCLYLNSGLVTQAWGTLGTETDKLLDVRELNMSAPEVFEHVFEADKITLKPRLDYLRYQLQEGLLTESAQTEELFLNLAGDLCRLQFENQKRVQLLPATKKATREELLRRLLIARDYLHDNITEPLNLSQLAEVAALSEFHFLRQFKAAFGKSPYQYLLQLRLQLAQHLLHIGGMSVTEVAQACGFREVQAFSKIFRKATGKAPSAYQRII